MLTQINLASIKRYGKRSGINELNVDFHGPKTLAILHCIKIKFHVKDFSKCDHIRSFLRIWPHLLKKSLMENFIFCAVLPSAFGAEEEMRLMEVLSQTGNEKITHM